MSIYDEKFVYTDDYKTRNTQFTKACEHGDIKTVKHLYKNSIIDVSYKDNYALCLAAANGHVDVVKYILENTNIQITNEEDNVYRSVYTAISYAVGNNKKDVLKLLLSDKRIKPSVVGYEFDFAVDRKNKESIVMLIEWYNTVML